MFDLRRNKMLRALMMSYPLVRHKYAAEARRIAKLKGGGDEVVKKMLHTYSRYHLNFEEYYAYRVWEKPPEELVEIVGDYDSWLYYVSVLNQKGSRRLLDDKFEAYKRYKDFYKREVVIARQGDVAEAAKMLSNYGAVIVKINGGSCGRGVKLLRHSTFDEDFKNLSEIAKTAGGCGIIVEEQMMPQSDFAALHPSSLNTIRVHTIRLKNGVSIIHPYVRIGRGGTIVDNAGSGGVFAKINVATGRLFDAVDEFGNVYDVHPDTHIRFKGFVVPQWQECIDFAKQLADVFPDNRFVGWDIALTTRGWCMIEGNFNPQFVFQMCDQKGCRSEFDKLMRQV